MWLGQEKEEHVARTRNCSGWPSSPHETQQLCRVNRPGNKNKGNGIGTGLAGKASRTALKTGSLFLAHAPEPLSYLTLQSRKVQNNVVKYN